MADSLSPLDASTDALSSPLDDYESLIDNKQARLVKRTIDLEPFKLSSIDDILLPPSAIHTVVRVTTRRAPVLDRGKSTFGSPEYYATLRRKTALKLIQHVEALAALATSENLVIGTRPIIESIKSALSSLEDSHTEGTSRAILRQIRDLILNGGWDRLRTASSRQVLIKALRILQKDGEIKSSDVDGVFDLLSDAGFDPIAVPAFTIDDDDVQEDILH